MTGFEKEHPTDDLFYSVEDPQSPLENCPATTTLLYRICNRDGEKFDEAIRLIKLFMRAAYQKGRANSGI